MNRIVEESFFGLLSQFVLKTHQNSKFCIKKGPADVFQGQKCQKKMSTSDFKDEIYLQAGLFGIPIFNVSFINIEIYDGHITYRIFAAAAAYPYSLEWFPKFQIKIMEPLSFEMSRKSAMFFKTIIFFLDCDAEIEYESNYFQINYSSKKLIKNCMPWSCNLSASHNLISLWTIFEAINELFLCFHKFWRWVFVYNYIQILSY